VPAADRLKPEIALVVDVRHLQPDLVDVPFQDYNRAVALEPCVAVAVDVSPHFVSEPFGFRPPAPCGWLLEAGWARGIEKLEQESLRRVVHPYLLGSVISDSFNREI